MKIVKNEKLIERNGKISNWVNLGSIILLGVGLYISFQSLDNPGWVIPAYALFIVGLVLMQIGMYMGNRWGRSPRRDEKMDAALKGLHSDFNLYHYSTPASHLLIGPAGVWALIPYQQGGTVYFEKNRWRARGGGFMQAYMRIFGQEGLGRPDLESEGEVAAVRKFLSKKMAENAVPEVKAVLVFTHDQVELEPGDSPVPAVKLKSLKGFMRDESRNRKLSALQIQELIRALEES